MIVFVIIVYILLALCVLHSKNKRHFTECFKMWLISFGCYGLVLFISHLYINNPETDYFINIDQLDFFQKAKDLASIKGFNYHDVFDEFIYSEAPLIYYLFALLYKLGIWLGIGDILLFMKLNVVFLASFVPPLIYKIFTALNIQRNNSNKKILIFCFLAPFTLLSCQLMRDIHVLVLYTLSFYLCINSNIRHRIIYLLFLSIILVFIRLESGLFSLVFPLVALWGNYRATKYRFIKLGIPLVIVIGLSFAVPFIINTMTSSITGYSEHSLEAASGGSLGALVARFPIPINYFCLAAFSQILPFPIWWPLEHDPQPYCWLVLWDSIFPFYWIAVWLMIFLNIRKMFANIPSSLLLLLLASILFIILCSIGEFNVRRIMAVYPIIFVACSYLKNNNILSTKYHYSIMSTVGLVFLHIIYLIIK